MRVLVSKQLFRDGHPGKFGSVASTTDLGAAAPFKTHSPTAHKRQPMAVAVRLKESFDYLKPNF